MGLMKQIHIELHNASVLIKWMESRIKVLELRLDELENDEVIAELGMARAEAREGYDDR